MMKWCINKNYLTPRPPLLGGEGWLEHSDGRGEVKHTETEEELKIETCKIYS
jgi:hypothetical protein